MEKEIELKLRVAPEDIRSYGIIRILLIHFMTLSTRR